jgi:spoIIIJ-associated protein
MEWVETTGNTLELAKEAALDELGVDEQDAEFEILEEPKVGLFGRVRAEGRVRARVRPTAPRPKEDRRDRKRSRNKDAASDGSSPDNLTSSTDSAAVATSADTVTPTGKQRGRRSPGAGSSGGTPATVHARTTPSGETDDLGTEDPETQATTPSAASRRSRSAGRGRVAAGETSDAPGAPNAGEAPAAPRRAAGERRPTDKPGEGPTVDVALEVQAQVAEEFLKGLLDKFGVTGQITIVQPDEDNIDLDIAGHDLGLLIGPKGATLLSIQDLTRTVVQRKTGAGNGRINVDVGGYRQKRSLALANFARQVASQVVSTGERRSLEPMSSADRKVVHDALTDVEGVSTLSEGEDPRRRVVIVPASN